MALEFSGDKENGVNGAGTYDHNLLINRGARDQHTIESITGLREMLNKKYEKPLMGIPKTDLAFDVATTHDLDIFKQIEIDSLRDDFSTLAAEVYQARGTEKTLKDYIDTKVSFAYWNGTGGVGGSNGSSQDVGYPLYESYIATEGQTMFALTKVYQVGTHQLEVYVNGLRMLESSDYTEVDDHHVTFLFLLEAGDEVLFMVRAVVNSGLHEEFIAQANQTDFFLTSPYGIYQNILQVYRNGNLLRKGRDYLEVTDKLVRFIKPLKAEDLITFHQAGATDPLAGTIMESEIGRIKLNQAYTTMNVNKAIKIEQTDYIDMFVDVFLSTREIDATRSLDYELKDEAIESSTVELLIDTTEEFNTGTFVSADATTFKNQLRIQNNAGGTVNNAFKPIRSIEKGILFNEAISVITPMEYSFHFHAEMKPGRGELNVIVRNQSRELASATIATTTGFFSNMSAVSDQDGNVHIVYCEVDTICKIHYACLNPLGMIDVARLVSDSNFDAYNPTLVIDKLGIIHIAFGSRRFNTTASNIDYVTLENNVLSGIQHLTTNVNMQADYPSLSVGETKDIHLVYEEDGNIQYTKIKDRLITYRTSITTDAFDNSRPQIAVDSLNRAHIVWRTQRLSTYSGFDYCTVSAQHVVSSRKSVLEGTSTLTIGYPRMTIDYENITHIVTDGNAKQASYVSVLYTRVHPDGTTIPFEVVGDIYEKSLADPVISTIGDLLLITTLGSDGVYAIDKSLANYNAVGQYTITLDSRSDQTNWTSIYVDQILSLNTGVKTRYRLSDDKIRWSSWKEESSLTKDTTTGRYMQLQLTLETTTALETPKILGISAICEPLWTEIYSVPKSSTKEIASVIVAARFVGDVEFFVSRDGGQHFSEAEVEKAVNLTATPSGQSLVLKVRIKRDAQLHAWGMVW